MNNLVGGGGGGGRGRKTPVSRLIHTIADEFYFTLIFCFFMIISCWLVDVPTGKAKMIDIPANNSSEIQKYVLGLNPKTV